MAQTRPKATFPLLPDLDSWASRPSWTVLDTGAGDGNYLWEWAARWRSDAQRPTLLHLVGFGCEAPPAVRSAPDESYRFHRENGSIAVTLCRQDVSAALRNHTFKADTVFLRAHTTPWSTAVFNALARHCKQGTALTTESALPWQHHGLLAAGFCEISSGCYRYAPAWTPKVRSGTRIAAGRPPSTCAVVGAGIAGASVAHALATRGWSVTVYDKAGESAAGASGLPAGLIVPHVSKDDNPQSQLSRAGTRLVCEFARAHLVDGTDWAPTGVMEQRWAADGSAIAPLWHPDGAWIKPARLVQAWLSHPNIRFVGNCHVAAVRRGPQGWDLHDKDAQPRGNAQVVVFANAFGCTSVIANLDKKVAETVEFAQGLGATLNALHCMHGTLSMGAAAAHAEWDHSAWPAYPCNGDGSFLPSVPTEHGAMWAAGASFEKEAERIHNIAQQHEANAARLKRLLPAVGEQLQSAFAGPGLQHWSGSRCVSHDRFPLLGPLDTAPQPSLWISAGMGSRGLSFVALCAQVLVARLCGEPLPVSDRLAGYLDVSRGTP